MGRFLYLEPVVSKIFPIHLLNCFTHTCNITVLQECILGNTIHFLNVNIHYATEALEDVAKVMIGGCLLQVANEESSRCFWVKLIYPFIQRTKFILTFCFWSYPGCHFNLHAKEKLSFGGIQCFFLVLLLSEEHQSIPLLRGPMDLHRRHLPILLEFMEKSIFKACIC